MNNKGFKKGHKPHNKGKKREDYITGIALENCKKGMYKKGHTPHNYIEIGSERLTKDGYVELKIDRYKWVLKHRYIYEKKYGEIPKGYCVIFLDHNKYNFDISNLKMISIKERSIMNRRKFFTNDKELTNTGTLIAEVISKSNSLRR